MLDLIIQAITKKKPVRAMYSGYERELCIHAVGTKRGKPQLIAYQSGGSSSSGPIVLGSDRNWRCMELAKLSDVEIIEGEWVSVSEHSRPTTCLDEITAEVEI